MTENSNENIHEKTSMYLTVNAVAARVKALMQGSTPLVQIDSTNLLDIAYEEIQRGLINITTSVPDKPEPTDEEVQANLDTTPESDDAKPAVDA